MSIAASVRDVLDDLRHKQTVVIPERYERLDPGLVQPRRTHQPDCVNAVRSDHHQTPFAQNDGIRDRIVRVDRLLRPMVKLRVNLLFSHTHAI